MLPYTSLSASSLQHTVVKFWTPYICIETPCSVFYQPTSVGGWAQLLDIHVRTEIMYTNVNMHGHEQVASIM